jgi:phosphoribosylaminoimidazolecarboxamide formyltransferase/IMP cyclohydrolase
MPTDKRIKSALISVFYKDGLEELARKLANLGITLYSTGGTRSFLEELGLEVEAVEDLTSYPSILGGRVKTLHPKVFGGILSRRNEESDVAQLEEFDIPELDLVIVDLYPFAETVSNGGSDSEIIEKIDIGGVSLIRAAAKNFNDVVIVSSRADYSMLEEIISVQKGHSTLEQRRALAARAFEVTANYDSEIANWFGHSKTLRYGENPHQTASFKGNLEKVFTQLHGKELSYNNLLDVEAALQLVNDFPSAGCAIIKHNNACGAALDEIQLNAWNKALKADPLSAFGGIFIFNTPLDEETASQVDQLFFEVILAPAFSAKALEILKSKKNRIILQTHNYQRPHTSVRSILNGVLAQSNDDRIETAADFKLVTEKNVDHNLISDLEFSLVLVKHTKSNAIVLVKDRQLLASGTGQTSRVDSLNQAVSKAGRMGLETTGAVLASDAFFPFADCIELSFQAGIKAIVQPGGSVRDQETIDMANRLGLAMVFTGIRHFKH